MPVVVDLSQVMAMTARAEDEFGTFEARTLQVFHDAAEEERGGHTYENRTGDLEASTYAVVVESSEDHFDVEFGAREGYASYLERRGLSHVTLLYNDALEEVASDIDAMGQRITEG